MLFSSPCPPFITRSSPRSPLAVTPAIVPEPGYSSASEFSDDSDSESDTASSPTSQRRRPVRGRHMHLRDPRSVGLYTLYESDEQEMVAPLRGLSIIVPGATSTFPSGYLPSPMLEDEDPFAFDKEWSNPAILVDESQATTSLSTASRLLTHAKNSRTRRPPPLELACADTPLSALRYPVSRYQLNPNRPNSPGAPRRTPLSPTRPLRVVSPNALPCTPAVIAAETFAPPPVFVQDVDSQPTSPVTPTTPTSDSNVNLVSALLDLLQSCGEYDDILEEDLSEDTETADQVQTPRAADFPDSSGTNNNVITPPTRSFSMPCMQGLSEEWPRSRSLNTRGERPLATLFADTFVPEGISLDNPLPTIQFSEPSDIESEAEDAHEDDTASLCSFSSLPELGYSSSSTSISSSITLEATVRGGECSSMPPAVFWYHARGSAKSFYSLPNQRFALDLEEIVTNTSETNAENDTERAEKQSGSFGRAGRRLRLPLPWATTTG